MRVLVAGASGLVGARLIEHLLRAEPGAVYVRAASRIERAWPAGVDGSVVRLDDPGTLDAACRAVDAVINLASMDERSCAADPQLGLRVNAGGTMALALAATAAGVKRFVQVSTYKVYGNSPSGVVTEDTATRPQSHYAITHRAAEDYARSQHPHPVVFRLANGFGAPVESSAGSWSIIVNGMCYDAAWKRHIAIRSSGRSWRNFIPMHDVVQALAAAARDLPAGTYNLGSPSSITLRDMADQVAQTCHETLGFRPRVTVGEVVGEDESQPLNFVISRLQEAGISPGGSYTAEIAATLRAAAEYSGPVRS